MNDIERWQRADKKRRIEKKENRLMMWSLLIILGYFLVYLGIAIVNFIG